jgi:outer membrane receptor protein involved in Fe transport
MNTPFKSFLAVVCLLPAVLSAQPGSKPGNGAASGVIVGQIYDADLNVPIEYANVVLYRQADSSLVTGTVTRTDGGYVLTGVSSGRFRVEMSFIGYRPVRVSDVEVAPGAKVDLGRTSLRQTAVAMPSVEATAERPSLSYKIDKKVIDVAHQVTAASGTAVDVLENVPSVKVDVEGNVALRGSRNFSVLIDGRPTLLDPSDALRQMPAGTLDRIEIITNPSAKYDAEGAAGIINLITKRRRGSGLSGVVNANGGLWNRYGGDFTLGWTSGILSVFAAADYNRRPTPGAQTSEQWTADTVETLHVRATGTSTRDPRIAGARAGFDLGWAKFDRSSFAIFYGSTRMGFDQSATLEQWSSSAADTAHYTSIDHRAQGGEYVSVALEHRHGFGSLADTAHGLTVRAELQRRGHTGSATTELFDGGREISGWRSTQSGPAFRWLLNADYVLPVKGAGRFEAGYQSSFGRPTFDNGLYQYDPVTDSFLYLPQYSSTTSLAYDIHALYSTWTGGWRSLEYAAGLRGEYSSQRIDDSGIDSVLLYNTKGLFPTAHLSYQLGDNRVLQASYTRRTRRPTGRDLVPEVIWQDAYNVQLGNPALLPEYIDSWEAGSAIPLGAGQASATLYYRTTDNKYDDIQSLYREGVVLHELRNVGNDRSLGAELSMDILPFKWWTISPSGDVYDYRIAGAVEGQEFSRSSLNWSARLSNELRLPTGTKIQLNAGYESPSASSQGRREGVLTTDLGIRQLFFKRVAAVFQVRDLLGTGGEETNSFGSDFYTRSSFSPRAPIFMLSLNWNFNNFRPTRRMRDTGREES